MEFFHRQQYVGVTLLYPFWEMVSDIVDGQTSATHLWLVEGL